MCNRIQWQSELFDWQLHEPRPVHVRPSNDCQQVSLKNREFIIINRKKTSKTLEKPISPNLSVIWHIFCASTSQLCLNNLHNCLQETCFRQISYSASLQVSFLITFLVWSSVRKHFVQTIITSQLNSGIFRYDPYDLSSKVNETVPYLHSVPLSILWSDRRSVFWSTFWEDWILSLDDRLLSQLRSRDGKELNKGWLPRALQAFKHWEVRNQRYNSKSPTLMIVYIFLDIRQLSLNSNVF